MSDEEACQNPVHGHPLPSGFLSASDMAEERLEAGWDNIACPDCGRFGWVPPKGES